MMARTYHHSNATAGRQRTPARRRVGNGARHLEHVGGRVSNRYARFVGRNGKRVKQ